MAIPEMLHLLPSMHKNGTMEISDMMRSPESEDECVEVDRNGRIELLEKGMCVFFTFCGTATAAYAQTFAGDIPLQASVGGVQTPSGVVISLQ
jgi:hypothetical protein